MARLLIVDDEADLLALLVRRLTAAGHTVAAADSAAAALAMVDRQGLPDAAILDVDLPGDDGLALAAGLRDREPGLPIAFLTVLWSGAMRSRIEAVDALYVIKPVNDAALADIVRQLLSRAGRAPLP
ncbi:MAG TPA: response regulator [Actinoplanes sp.]|jgi:DNA-binding response OmpR family regulator